MESSNDDLRCKTGTMPTGEGLYIRYWVYTSKKNHQPSLPPVIAIHGGPGFTHNYMLPLQLLAREGYTVIFYDQCGCGASSFVASPSETHHPYLLTVGYYVQELSSLVKEIGLEGKPHYLYGSSWGTVVAQEYAVTQPRGLAAMILDGALCDAQVRSP